VQKLIRLMSTSLLVLMCEQAVAEGTFQMDAAHPQPLDSNSRLLIHVDDAKPFIRLHLCQKDDSWTNDKDESVNAVGAKIYSTRLDDGKYVADVELAALTSSTANISCANTMDNPLPAIPVSGEQMQYRVARAGVYMVIPSHSSSPYERWDVSTVALASDNVDPTADDGNLFSYKWMFRTDDYSAATAATTKMYVLVPGGFEDTNYIWALDLQQFSGNVYDIVANNIGLDAPYSGISTPQDKSPTVQEKFPVYLSYPKGANPHPAPDLAPQLIDTLTFTDDAGNDNIISPDGDAVEETGIFSFTPNVSGTYAITIDINRDGDFGANDRLLLGAMEANTQVDVSWDGKDAAGDVVSQAEYGVKLELRIGEYHFVGSDVETSGGGVNNGLTILRAEDATTLVGTQVFWDDKTLLSATSNLPAGALSSEASVGAHRHTWGDLTGRGIGDESFIDTYVYGKSSEFISEAIVEHKNAPVITSNGGDYSVIIEVYEQSTAVTKVETSGGSGSYTYLLSDKDAAKFSIAASGELTFNSAPIFATPTDSDGDNDYILVVTANDGTLNTQQAITVRVKKFNTAPVATEQTLTTKEDEAKAITLIATDADGNTLSYALVGTPQHGVLSGSGATRTYTPNKDYSGSDSFSFKANDGTVDSNIATVNITVTPQNDAPVAKSQTLMIKEDEAKAITLVATDAETAVISRYTIVTMPSNGVLTGSGANLTYTPNKDYSGSDSFSFKANDGTVDSNTATVNITVTPQNDAPVAKSQTLTIKEDLAAAITLVATDADGNTLSYALVGTPQHGVLTGSGANLTYTPNKDYSGSDSFSFKANDGTVDSNTATVNITVTPQNDAPVAKSQTLTIKEDLAAAITLVATDADGNTLSYALVGTPQHGVLSGSGATRTYTPNKDYSGSDSFSFKANDGTVDSNIATVNITVTQQNDAPVAKSQTLTIKEEQAKAITLIATDADGNTLSYALVGTPQHGVLSGSGATRTYTPNKDYSGSDSFSFKANDGTVDSNIATVNITVTPQNDAPVAVGQTLTTNQEQPKTVTLSATDVDGNSLSYTLVTPPTKGQLSGTGKTLVYIPNKGASGRDSFSFKASDGLADSNIANISIDIVKVNDAPEADVQTVLVTQDTPTAITLSGSDKQGTTLSFTVISLPENGTLSGDAPYLIYTPETGYFGTDSLSFKVNDGEQDSNIATVSIEVLQDLDGDGIADVTDPDDDGDGIDDVIEGEGDTDGDGIPDSRDLDSDGDGIPDSKEGQTDTDGDGIPDYQDTSIDDDHDGIPDVVEGRGDFDGDGIPNFLDIDSDNDGLVDGFEAGISGTDSDGDGIDDGYDVEQTGGVDVNGDGIDDDIVPLDTDKDGKPDYTDKDSDNDLIPDAVEASQTRKDTDGDGIADNYDIDVTVGSDADGDGIDDRFDIDIVAGFDADGDGINDAKLIETDKDADGVADFMDQDSDNDGIWDTAEADAWNRDDDADGIDDKFDYDFNVGKDDNNDGILDGVIRTDTDGDGIIDMHDLDSDNDGLLDTIESGSRDEDGDGQVDMGNELISAPKDTDGDGQADFRDLDSDDDQGFDIDASPEKKLDKDNDGRIDTTLDRDLDGIDDSIDNALDLFGTALGVDGDGDGVSAGLDLDDDNDGISDVIEGLHDSDHDTISDHLDKDSDNDGLSDAFENDRPAPHGLDGDRDGIDDAWDVDMTAGNDADNDGIDDRYSVIDTDKDGLPDNLDTDSDNDGISDTQEQVMVELMDRDSDMDGIDDAFDVDVTSGVDTDWDGIDDSVFNAIDFDGDGIANFRDLDSDGDGVLDAVEGIVDTDKDGQADFLDIDSDNDNILDGNENGDYNQDGINDRLQASSKVETGIDGAGAINLLGLLGLLCVALIRRTKACIVMLLSVLALFSVTVQANESCSLEGAVQESGCWYLGAGVGVSRLMPDKHDTSWRVSDSQDTAFKLLSGYGFTEHWFGEISYENMGAASLTNANPAIKDRPEIGYSAFGGSLGYWLFEQSNTWNLYAKTGVAFLQTDTGPYVEQSHSNQWTLGVGAQWRFSDHWFARVGIDAYDRDARVVGLTIGRYFGGSAKSVVKHVEPAVIVARSSIVLDHDNDGVTDKMDLCPTTAAEAVVDEDGCPLLETITLHVQFDTASWVVKPAYLEQINSVSEKLKQFKKARFTVEGHTDWQGKQADNQILSEHRAEAVAEILMQKTGMDRDRFTVAGHGELQPKADNNTDEGRIENRRVEIRIDNR